MNKEKDGKMKRVLGLYTRLKNGEVVNKAREAQTCGVNERSIQRDIDDIRAFIREEKKDERIIYNRVKKGYLLKEKIKAPAKEGEEG